ncbi:MAG: helix-turn-helix domain-containing protein [Phycisphaerales bacterium]|nr:helix-turn-helix domain-containing protein [Phycisphaerales bacterium]
MAKRRAIPSTEPPARPPAVITEWLTPPEVAALLRIRLEKVLGWVRDGRLLAVNVAADGSSRPRWRISRAALELFLAARSNRPAGAAAPSRRRSRSSDNEVVEYF